MNADGTKQTHGDAVRAGMKAKAMAGVPAGPVPLGYRKVRRDGTAAVEIDWEMAPLVREAFRLAALRQQSLRKILTTLDGQGLTSQRGKPLSATALWRILTNPFYVGTIAYDSETAAGAYAPLVSRRVYDQTQYNLARRNRRPDQDA